MELINRYIKNFNEIVKNLSFEIDNGKCNLSDNLSFKEEFSKVDLQERDLKILNIFSENFSIYWEYKSIDDDYQIGGEINYINPFRTSLNNTLNYLTDSGLSELLIFESHPLTGDGVLIGFLPQKEGGIWIIDSNGNPLKVNLNFIEYFKKNIEFRGYIDWQYLFCDIDIQKDYFIFVNQRLKKLFKDLPLFFPDFNKKEYLDRYFNINGDASILSND
ncbi:hypothetical protein [Aquimarina latercula]|uniref:hypothetical protein n=1 Tax=Aquimarina latercula TaxID=987 RepID=UPI0004058C45|nr:hypothetical protein [Aquimarina latercula]